MSTQFWHNTYLVLTDMISVKKIPLPQFLTPKITPKTHNFANLQQKCSKVLKQCWQCWQCWPMTMLIMLAMLTMLTMPTLVTMIMLSCGTVEAIWKQYMSHSQMLGEFEYGGGPIFKVVLECKKRCSEPFLIYIYGIQCDFMPKSCWKHSNFENR